VRQAELDAYREPTHLDPVIRTFRSRALRNYFETGNAGRLSVPNIARVGRMLRALDAATRPEQLNLPGYHFHALRGVRRWSLRVTGNWRITFGWDGTDAIDVDLQDYH
jgi:proteic killer suppression protein